MASMQPPKSYTELSKTFGHIKVSHVPANAPEATPVLLVTLNRPDKGNAFTGQMQREICAAYEYFENDPRVKAVVLTGAGKAYCFGADLEIGFLGGASKSGAQNSSNAKAERDVGEYFHPWETRWSLQRTSADLIKTTVTVAERCPWQSTSARNLPS